MSVTGTRVFGHPQVVEYQAYVTRESSHFLRHAPAAFGFEHADGETAKPRDVFRAVTGADATAVFIIVPVDDVVTTVLNRPVSAVDFENLMRAGLLGGLAGYAVGYVRSAFSSLFLRDVPLDDEGLAHVRKVEVIVQFRALYWQGAHFVWW